MLPYVHSSSKSPMLIGQMSINAFQDPVIPWQGLGVFATASVAPGVIIFSEIPGRGIKIRGFAVGVGSATRVTGSSPSAWSGEPFLRAERRFSFVTKSGRAASHHPDQSG